MPYTFRLYQSEVEMNREIINESIAKFSVAELMESDDISWFTTEKNLELIRIMTIKFVNNSNIKDFENHEFIYIFQQNSFKISFDFTLINSYSENQSISPPKLDIYDFSNVWIYYNEEHLLEAIRNAPIKALHSS